MSRLCPICHESMYGESAQAVFHDACGRERRKVIDRLDKRARRLGKEPERFCAVCLGPREKGARMCPPCTHRRAKEGWKRYSQSPKGRATQVRYSQSPKCKIRRAAYVDAHREQKRAAGRRYSAKIARSGTVLPCATLLCEGTFVRTRHNGRRLFCDECQFVHRTITPVEARRRGTLRYYGKAA